MIKSPPSIRPVCYLILNHWTKSNQIWCVSCSHKWGTQQQNNFDPPPGEASKGQISNVHKYDDSNRSSTFHIMWSPILRFFAKTAYLAIAQIVFCKNFDFFRQMFRSKSKILKPVQFLVEDLNFSNYLPFNWISFEIKMLSRSNPPYKIQIWLFRPLAGSH